MAYGTVKVDNVTFTYNSADATTTFSGFYASTTNNLTLSGTASAATFTGTTANFTNVNAQNISVTTITGTTASFTSGVFTSLSGTTHTITSGVFASGTAALPSISFVSDPNTGVFSPGADQLAVATNGTQQITIDSSGRLLAGTATARSNFYGGYTARAQIEGVDFETAALNITCNNATDINSGVISLNKSGGATVGSNTIVSSGERLGSIRFQGNDGTNFQDAAYVLAEVDGTPGANDMPGRLVFSTTADGGSLPSERLRITSAGLVGIGSSSPVSKINSVISQADNAAASDTTLANSFLHLGGGEYGINRYFLTTYGYSTGRTNSGAFIGAIGASASGFGKYDLVFGTRDVTTDTAPDTRMIIKTDGKVGIGVTSPAGSTTGPSLDVNGPLFVRSPIVAHQTNAGVLQYTSNETSIRSYGGAAGSGQIVFNTGGGGGSADAEAVRIDSSRRLLVGTSSTAQAATAIFQGYDGVSTNPAVVRLCRGVATPADGDPLGYLTFGDSGQYSSGQIAVFRDGGTWTSGTSMPTRLTFSTTADGGSSPTERLRITSTGQVRLAGAGITFNGDTAAANELDDYEEGTFTPTVGAGITINSGTPAYSGFYTKIGRMVHITISQTAGNITATVGAGSVFTGLPFTPGTLLHACSVTNGAPNISGTGSIYNSPGTGVIYIGFTATSQTNLTFTGTYFV